ncbi:MAG TPA: glutaredoxin [Burkholderiaceae bacterium]|nr:glutaredoxin [Burkholderiaceae bacterium]
MKIRLEMFVAPGCACCDPKREALRAVTAELGPDRFEWREIDLLEHVERAVEPGVRSPPSLAIDAALVFPARATPERPRAELARRLTRRAGPALR